MNNTRNYGTNKADKHKNICQRLCQEETGKQVCLDQRTAMRECLKYEGHGHEKAIKRLYTVKNLINLSGGKRHKVYPGGNVP